MTVYVTFIIPILPFSMCSRQGLHTYFYYKSELRLAKVTALAYYINHPLNPLEMVWTTLELFKFDTFYTINCLYLQI